MLQVTWLLVLANKSALFHGLSICKLMRLRWGGRSILTPEITVLVSASIYKFSVWTISIKNSIKCPQMFGRMGPDQDWLCLVEWLWPLACLFFKSIFYRLKTVNHMRQSTFTTTKRQNFYFSSCALVFICLGCGQSYRTLQNNDVMSRGRVANYDWL